jgi:hypothetical protein
MGADVPMIGKRKRGQPRKIDALVVEAQTAAHAPPVNEIAELPILAMKHEGNMPNSTHYALLKSSSANVNSNTD